VQAILGPDRWAQLVRDFYRHHRCHTPLFLEMSQEFLAHPGDERAPSPSDPPFLLELAQYEWVELALSIDEACVDEVDIDRDGNLLEGVPVLSPLAWPLAYDFPVHRLSPQFQPSRPPAERSFHIACRNRSDKVHVMTAGRDGRFGGAAAVTRERCGARHARCPIIHYPLITDHDPLSSSWAHTSP